MRLLSKIVLLLSLLLVFVCTSDVNAQGGCAGSLKVSGCNGSATVSGYGLPSGYGILRKIAARTTRPVANTLAYVVQNRPRPVERVVQSVRSANCGCPNCTCGDSCNCGAEVAAVNCVQAVPVLRAREVVYNCDPCGQAHVAPVVAAVRNIITSVPRVIQNTRAVRQANLTTSNLFFVPVEKTTVETVPSSIPESSINDSVTSLDPIDLKLASI